MRCGRQRVTVVLVRRSVAYVCEAAPHDDRSAGHHLAPPACSLPRGSRASQQVRDVDANYKGVQMSLAYLAQPEQQPTVEWLAGGTFAVLLDAAATNGQLGVGRFRVSMGEAPPYHKHLREDEVFMLIKGTALLWCDDEEMELSEGGIVFLPRNVPHSYRITSPEADLLMMCTPGGFEGMFRQAGKPVTSPRQPGAEPSREDMVKAADDFGQVVIGPPR